MLSFLKFLREQKEEHHHFVVPLMSGKPHPHMGHQDLINGMKNAAKKLGVKAKSMIVGLHRGSKNDPIPGEEKAEIFRKQTNNPSVDIQPEQGTGGSLRRAVAASGKGLNHLHLVVGFDRLDMAHETKEKIEDGTFEPYGIPRNHFKSITIHGPDGKEYPKGSDVQETPRQHGMSGTKMRESIVSGDIEEYRRHLGTNFSKSDAKSLMKRMSGIKIKRPGKR